MTNDLKLSLRLTADGKGFVGEVRVADKELRKLTGGVRRGQRAHRDYSRSAKDAERQTRETGKSFGEAHGRAAKYVKTLGGVAIAYQAFSAVRGLSRQADAWTELNNRLRLVSQSEAALTVSRRRLHAISQETRTSVEANVQLYARLRLATENLNRSEAEALQVTRLLNQQVAIGGSDASEAAAGLVQFAQGLASGRLQGDELRSVLENLQGVNQGLITGFRKLRERGQIDFDVTRGNIRELAADGVLSAELLFDAVLASQKETERKFKDILVTVSGGLVQIQNSLLQVIGSIDQTTGASAALASKLTEISQAIDTGSINALSESLGVLDEAVLLLIARFGGGAVVSLFGSAAASIASVSTVAAGATGKMKLLTGAGAALRGGLALLGGPAGAAVIAAIAIARLGANSLEAQSRLLLLPPAIEEVAEAVTKLTTAEKELLKPQIVGELTKVSKEIEAIQNNTAFQVGVDTPLQRGLEAKIQQLKTEEARLNKVLRELYRPTPALGTRAAGGTSPTGNSAAFDVVLAALEDQEKQIRERYAAQIAVVREATPQQVEALQAQGLTVAQAVRELEQRRDAEIGKLSAGGPKSDPFARTLEGLKGQEQRIRERYAAQIAVIQSATAEQVQALQAQGLTVTQAMKQLETQRDAELQQLIDGSKHQQARADINEAVLSLLPPLEQATAAADAWRTKALAGLDTTAMGYDDLAAKVEQVYQERIAQALSEDVERRRQAAEEVLANSTRWQDGVLRALDQYNQGAVNAAGLAESATTNALQNMQGALEGFVQTGKLSFSDFARSVLLDLTRIAAHQAFSSLFAGAFGSQASLIAGQTGFGGGVGGVLSGAEFAAFHAGGIVGQPASRHRRISPGVFAAAQRYHNGGLAGDEVPAILRRGEEVLPANHPRHQANAGGGTVVIHQSFDFRNADEPTVPRLQAEAERIKEQTKAEIINYLGNTRRGLALTGRG